MCVLDAWLGWEVCDNAETMETTQLGHRHIFLGQTHTANERRTWAVIGLCFAMMVLEIGGGLIFGSVALVADGLHMSTHAGALFIAAFAYTYARRHAEDKRFAFGTGKLGDLAGFTSAVILAMIAVLIAWEAVDHLRHPGSIDFAQAIPIAVLGLAVNIASAWLLGGDHDHDHHDHDDDDHDDHDDLDHHEHHAAHAHRDYNMRAAFLHVIADAAVSVLVIAALLLAMQFGWMWMDPLAGLIGAVVIASWAWTLIRDTAAVLLDMTPDLRLAAKLRRIVEQQGDVVMDLHLWRLGPGHLGAIVSVLTGSRRTADFYHARFAGLGGLSHVTVEVRSGLAD
jgi:cation diffusion facilitator family transporter